MFLQEYRVFLWVSWLLRSDWFLSVDEVSLRLVLMTRQEGLEGEAAFLEETNISYRLSLVCLNENIFYKFIACVFREATCVRCVSRL